MDLSRFKFESKQYLRQRIALFLVMALFLSQASSAYERVSTLERVSSYSVCSVVIRDLAASPEAFSSELQEELQSIKIAEEIMRQAIAGNHDFRDEIRQFHRAQENYVRKWNRIALLLNGNYLLPMELERVAEDDRRRRSSPIEYLGIHSVERFRLMIKNGLLYLADEETLFDTSNSDTRYRWGLIHQVVRLIKKNHRANIIMDANGNFYALPLDGDDEDLRHSSLSMGAPIAFAGEIEVRNGKLILINNKSGHYKIPPALFKQAIIRLRKLGVRVPAKAIQLEQTNESLNILRSREAYWESLGIPVEYEIGA